MSHSFFKVIELKAKLRSFGLKTNGRKAELIERLNKYNVDALKSQHRLRSFTIRLERIDVTKYRTMTLANQRNASNKNTHQSDNASNSQVTQRNLRSHTQKAVGLSNGLQHQAIVETVHDSTLEPIKSRDQPSKYRRIELSNAIAPKIPNKMDVTVMKKRQQNIRRQSRKVVANVVAIMPSLYAYEVIWAKIRGYPWWPGVIEHETLKGKYVVHFFGDYTKFDIGRNNIIHVLEGFNQFAKSPEPSTKLKKAVKECQLFLFQDNRPQSCLICDMLKIKMSLKN